MRARSSVVSCGCVRTFIRLLGFLRPYRRGAIWSVVLAGIAMLGTAAIPWLIGRAIDDIDAGDKSRPRDAVRAARRGRPRAARLLGRAADRVGQGLARRRVRPAQRALRPPAGARARLLRPPADRPAHVARDGRPAVDPLLPRLRLRLDRPERADDPVRGGRDVRQGPGAGGAVARAGAVRGRRRLPLRAPLAPGPAGGPAAGRRADRRGGGERLRRPRGQGVRGRAAPARALPRRRPSRLRPGDVLDPPERLLPAVHRLPAPARPRGDPDRRRPPGDQRHADRPATSRPSTRTC